MAQKRMFSRQITESDSFLDLPLTAQCLYFHLSLTADDEGFISSCKRILRAIGATETDLDALVSNGFLIFFPEANVYVDKAFCLNNSLRSDRFHPTTYQTERKQLTLTENKVYQLIPESDNQLSTNCQPESNREEYSPEEKRKEKKRKDDISSEEGSSEGGDNNDLLLYLAQQAGIKTEVEPALNRHGFEAALNAFVTWKEAGGIIGQYKNYVEV